MDAGRLLRFGIGRRLPMAQTQRLARLLAEARELPKSERDDFVRLIRKEDARMAARLELLLEEAEVRAAPSTLR